MCFNKYDAFCSHSFDYAYLRRKALLSKRFKIMEKLFTSNTFLKMAGGGDAYPPFYPLDPPLAISYRDHQKSLAYFSHLAPLTLFFFTKRQSHKEEAMAQCPSKYATEWKYSNTATRKLLTLIEDVDPIPCFNKQIPRHTGIGLPTCQQNLRTMLVQSTGMTSVQSFTQSAFL